MSFILFWFACAWLTLLALLLTVFDLLIVRAYARGRAQGFASAGFRSAAQADGRKRGQRQKQNRVTSRAARLNVRAYGR